MSVVQILFLYLRVRIVPVLYELWHFDPRFPGRFLEGKRHLCTSRGARFSCSPLWKAGTRGPHPGCQRSQSAWSGLPEVRIVLEHLFSYVTDQVLYFTCLTLHPFLPFFLSVSGKELIQSSGDRLRLLVARSDWMTKAIQTSCWHHFLLWLFFLIIISQ